MDIYIYIYIYIKLEFEIYKLSCGYTILRNNLGYSYDGRSQWPRGLTRGSAPLACWVCEFESIRWHGCLSLVSVVFCPVEVSTTSWSLVQRCPTECGHVWMWSRNLNDGRHRPTRAVELWKKKKNYVWWEYKVISLTLSLKRTQDNRKTTLMKGEQTSGA